MKNIVQTKTLSLLLALAMLLSLVPGMGLTAYATPTETLLTTITATGQEQASYSVENIASVSFSYTANGSSAYYNKGTTNWGWWGYGWTATVTPADGYTITKCVFYDDKDRTATDSEAPFVVETTEEDKTPQVNGTPILAYQSKGITKIEVYGYVTPSVVSTVTLNTNGGIINAGNVTEYTEGTGATLPTDVTKNNYTFGGWYDNSELTGDAMEAISPSETGDKTYWAKWTMNGDQQIFVKLRDGATKTVNVDMTDTIAVVKQKASDLFECAYEKMFLIFAGKLLDDDAKTLEQCNIQKEATLHLIVGYFVTFESNGGSAVAGKPVSENATMVAPDEPTKAEHTFVGWYKEPALTNAWDFDNDTVTEDITLYAKWTENPNITELTFSGYNGDYDTNGHGAVVTGDTSNYTIRYSTDGVEYTFEQTPTYTAVSQHTIYYQVTRDGYKTLTGSVEIVIGKATPSYTVPTGLVATYGDMLSSISLPTGWAWADNTASVGNAGTNTFAATFTPEDTANYNTVEQNLSVTVGKATPSYTVPTDLVATYGDTLSSISLPTGWAWTNGAQSVGNAGTNTFKATFTPTDTTNYNTVTDIDVTVTVGKADPSYEVPTGLTAVFGNLLSSVLLPDGWSWTNPLQSVGNAIVNTFKAIFTPADTANYKTVENIDVDVTVNKADIAPTVSLEGWTYGETAKPPVVSGNPSEGTVTYTYAVKGNNNFSATVPTNAGTYTVKATIAATANYNGATATADFTIAKADITPTVSLEGWAYGATAKTPVVTGNSGNGAVSYTYAVKGGEDFSATVPTNAGTYTVKATVAATENYNGGTATADFTIAKADINPTVSLEGWTYGQAANAPSVSGNSGNGAVTYTYATKGSDSFGATVPTNAGNYTVKATIAATANYNGATATADFTIAKANITPTVSIDGWTYNQTAKTPSVSGNSGNGAVTYTYAAKGSDSFSATVPTNAGNYTVKATIAATTNYNGATATADFTITKADPTYTVPTGLTATYGQTLANVTLPTGWAWVDSTQSVGNIGTNTFKANFTPADTANYNTVSGVDVNVTVGKTAGKDATISTDTMTYNSDSIYIEGVAGQEYVIVPKGTAVTDADWNTTVKPDPERENWVFFENLKEATEYEIYTRTAETDTAFASDAVKANVYTTLSSIGYLYDSTLVGASITVEPEPNVEGLTYKWYQDEVTEDGEGIIHHNLTEIPGATGSSYTFREEDVGKHITVKIFAGQSEVGDVSTGEPVVLTAKVIFDSMGGSDVETITDLGYRSKITKPEDPIRMGYAFVGWYWEEELVTLFDFENDVITWNKTTLYAKWTPNDYKITSVTGLSGNGEDEWTKGGEDGVVITVKDSGEDNSFDHFTGVKLDGKLLTKDVDYTVKKGSTIVTLLPATLEKLSVGEHTVTVLFDNGEVNTDLTVKAANSGSATSPQTGDNSHMGLWIAIMILSLCALAATLFIGKKKRVFDR